MIVNKNLKQIIEDTAKELDLPAEVVNSAYLSYWQFARETLSSLNLKNVQSEEELEGLRTSINIPSIGKIHTSWQKIENQRKRYQFILKLRENGKKESN